MLKTITTFFVALFLSLSAQAATLTITTSGAEDARIVVAFGTYLNLGRNATGPEVKAALIQYVKHVVREQEKQAAMAQAEADAAAVSPVTPQ